MVTYQISILLNKSSPALLNPMLRNKMLIRTFISLFLICFSARNFDLQKKKSQEILFAEWFEKLFSLLLEVPQQPFQSNCNKRTRQTKY